MPLPFPRMPRAVDMIHGAGLTLAGGEYTACWSEQSRDLSETYRDVQHGSRRCVCWGALPLPRGRAGVQGRSTAPASVSDRAGMLNDQGPA